jgi:hypothetical protein
MPLLDQPPDWPKTRDEPPGWPKMTITGQCQTCGDWLFSEVHRPATIERWLQVTRFWLLILERHRDECPRRPAAPAEKS